MVAANTHLNGANGTEAPAIIGSALTPDRFGIGRDRVNEAIADLSPVDGETIEWFWSYCAQRNLGRDRVGELLLKPNGRDRYSPDAVYQLLTGKRMKEGANISPMLRAIE